jgi:hypothetical protein
VTVKTIWTGRVAQATARYGDQVPMVTACCNACRTCVSSNIIGLVTAGIAGTAYGVAAFVRRRFRGAVVREV